MTSIGFKLILNLAKTNCRFRIPSTLSIVRSCSSHSNYHQYNNSLLSTNGSRNDDSQLKNNDKEDDFYEDAFEDRIFRQMMVDDFNEIIKSESDRERIELVLQEYEYIKYNRAGRVPSNINPEHMMDLIQLEPWSSMTRERYIDFLFQREMAKLSGKRKKLEDRKEREKIRELRNKELREAHGEKRAGLLDENGNIIYGLWHNALFPRINDTAVRKGRSLARLRQAALFGPQLVLDCAFDGHMTRKDSRNVAEQIQVLYGLNRYSFKSPFDLWLCNYDVNGEMAKWLENKALVNIRQNSMITITPDCYTNHFERNRLIYLSPHSSEILEKIEEDDVLVIGALNDKSTGRQLTSAKAKEQRIRTKRLPLDQYIAWRAGTKSLCLNHVMGILLEFRECSDWRQAFERHIPSRKIKSIEEISQEEAIRLSKLTRRAGMQPPHKFKRRVNLREDIFDL